MSFSKLINKTKKGETLSEKEVNELARHLGLKETFFSMFFKILLILVVSVICGYLVININIAALQIIFSVISLVIIVFILLTKGNTSKIIKYLEVVQEFYIDRLCEYEGFESVFVQHQFVKNGYLQNTLAIFASDGYEFYIFDDLMKETMYRLPFRFSCPINKRPCLKIFDQEFVRKRPICFQASEIDYYQMYKPYVGDFKEKLTYGYEFRRYTFTVTNMNLNNYCLLVLKDGSTFKLAPEAVVLLRKKAKKKERE